MHTEFLLKFPEEFQHFPSNLSANIVISDHDGNSIKREKGIWWMPWRIEAMKDVIGCDKPR
jgi:hypothetical protein